MQHMPHFRRKGKAQDLTAKDTTVYEQLVHEEDPDYANILKSRDLGSRSKRQDLSESDVSLALDSNAKRIRCVSKVMLSRASFRIITRYNKTDLKGVVAGVCPHYLVLMVLEASNPENHAHYFQILDSLKHRFMLERASANSACRMVEMFETER